MQRERVLKIVLVVVGLLFCAAIYPLILMAKQDPALAMMMSLYATLGIFLLRASRNPSAHRSLIAFAAWSSFAHAAVMSFQALLNIIARNDLVQDTEVPFVEPFFTDSAHTALVWLRRHDIVSFVCD